MRLEVTDVSSPDTVVSYEICVSHDIETDWYFYNKKVKITGSTVMSIIVNGKPKMFSSNTNPKDDVAFCRTVGIAVCIQKFLDAYHKGKLIYKLYRPKGNSETFKVEIASEGTTREIPNKITITKDTLLEVKRYDFLDKKYILKSQ